MSRRPAGRSRSRSRPTRTSRRQAVFAEGAERGDRRHVALRNSSAALSAPGVPVAQAAAAAPSGQGGCTIVSSTCGGGPAISAASLANAAPSRPVQPLEQRARGDRLRRDVGGGRAVRERFRERRAAQLDQPDLAHGRQRGRLGAAPGRARGRRRGLRLCVGCSLAAAASAAWWRRRRRLRRTRAVAAAALVRRAAPRPPCAARCRVLVRASARSAPAASPRAGQRTSRPAPGRSRRRRDHADREHRAGERRGQRAVTAP